MTTDTTMTDVDTSTPEVERYIAQIETVFGDVDCSALTDKLRALAAERDELERLVSCAASYFGSPPDGNWCAFDEDEIVRHEVDIRIGDIKEMHAIATAYQRKGKGE